jgi:hypothetical protein
MGASYKIQTKWEVAKFNIGLNAKKRNNEVTKKGIACVGKEIHAVPFNWCVL